MNKKTKGGYAVYWDDGREEIYVLRSEAEAFCRLLAAGGWKPQLIARLELVELEW